MMDAVNNSSSESDGDWSEEEGEGDLARLDLLPNGRRNLKHASANMVADMRGVSGMTRVGVRRAMRAADLILKVNNSNLKEDVSNYLASVNLLRTPQAQQLLRKFDAESPFKGMFSNESQISALKRFYFVPKQETVYLWNRMDQRLDGDDAYIQRPVPNTYEYVHLKDIVRQVASRPEMLAYMRSLHPSDNGMLNSFTDGDQYRRSHFFQQHPDAFQFVLYFDGVDPARCQGPKAGMHELGNFLLRILNLPPKVNNTMASVFPLILANTNDCKDTFEGVLRRLVDDIIEFENGVIMYFDRDRIETIYGTLVAVKGDAKAIHAILGFLDCGARHFCPCCMISRPELHAGDVALGEPRTPELSEEQLRLVQQREAYSTHCGLRHRTVLHDTLYFRAENNKTFDGMHDFAEGLIPMVIRLCLKELIVVQQLVDVNALNARIFAFNYGRANHKDKPNIVFNVESLRDADRSHNMNQNAVQTMVLFRALPFLLDNLAEGNQDQIELNEKYQIYLLLMKIFHLAMAPKIPRDILPLLRRYLELFRRSWYNIFPGVNPTNKFHHIMHLADNIEEKGPARQFFCFKEESQNCPVKRHIVTCNNFINPQKTSMEQALIFQAKAWGGRELNILQKTRYTGNEVCAVQDLPCAAALQALLGLPPNSLIQTVKAVEIFGVEYRRSQYLLIIPESQDNDSLPCFGRISTIIRPVVRADPETVIFGVEACVTNGLVERFNAYSVSLNDNAPHHLIDLHDLPHHPPISPWHDFSHGGIYLSLKHAVF